MAAQNSPALVTCRCYKCGEDGKRIDPVHYMRHQGGLKGGVNRWCVSARGMMPPKEV